MSKKSLIDSVKVENPCSKEWEQMLGNDRIRICEHCAKNVTNLSAITRKEALRVVNASNGEICIRYINDPATNRPIFADRMHQITRRAPRLAAGVMAASLTLSGVGYAQSEVANPTPYIFSAQNEAEADVDSESADEATDPTLGSLSGVIWDSNGKPVADLTLRLDRMGDDPDTDYEDTGEDGTYSFDELDPGTYVLRIESLNGVMKKVAPRFELSEGQREIKNFQVTRVPATESEATGWGVGGAIAMTPYTLPLSMAVSMNDIALVQQLLNEGERPNGRDTNYDDITPLFLAVENGSVEIAKLLLKFGADVNAVDKRKRTPLMFIDRDATLELTDLLLAAGAKVNAKDELGNTALLNGAGTVETEVLKALINAGADVNAGNAAGETPLMTAAEEDDLERVTMLLVAGADVGAKNENDETAWDKTSDSKIEDLLASYGAAGDYGTIFVAERSPETDEEETNTVIEESNPIETEAPAAVDTTSPPE